MTAVETRPRGFAVLLASPRAAVALTILAGAAISLQSYLNGRLGKEVGSATIAAAINNMVAFVATLAIALAIRALPRACARLRARSGGRPLGTSSAVSAARRSCSSPRRRRPR